MIVRLVLLGLGLLAGLQLEPVRKSPGKRKRSGPITQAELDLQQSLLASPVGERG